MTGPTGAGVVERHREAFFPRRAGDSHAPACADRRTCRTRLFDAPRTMGRYRAQAVTTAVGPIAVESLQVAIGVIPVIWRSSSPQQHLSRVALRRTRDSTSSWLDHR